MKKDISLCLGYFDSVHLGHRELIGRSFEYALSHDLIGAVYTFKEDNVGMFDSLYSFEERSELLKKCGVSLIISDIFSESFRQKTGEEFLDYLRGKMNIKAFFCGYDYTFGRNASCNAQFLSDYARHNKIYCEVIPPVELDGAKVSTSRIKQLLKEGLIEKANKLLVTPYHMTGKVIHGRGVGRRFGIPTANIAHDGFLPADGVYKTLVDVDGKSYVGVTNIGAKPTFGDEIRTIETMLIGFDGDLYDKQITVSFFKYLRPVFKFKDGNELSLQIQNDIKEAIC